MAAEEIDIEVHVHLCLSLPVFQWDLLAHAANGLISRQPPLRALRTSELLNRENFEVEE